MKANIATTVVVAVALLAGCLAPTLAAAPESVRSAGVAGTFYPGNPNELKTTVDGFLAHAAVPAPRGEIVALIAPHAGYAFSGAVAAHSYAMLKGRPTHRVVVVAPSHFEACSFTSVYDGDAYTTPLGKVAVDKEFARKLVRLNQEIKLSSRGHAPTSQGSEHALEVQLPFLQRALGGFQLVPIIMGDQTYQASRALGVALAELVRGTDTLIVASSDLSHYHPYQQAVNLDGKTLNAIQEWNYLAMSDNFQSGTWEACGGAPIIATMIAAELLGANRADVIKYANSGDVTGDRSRVVGYGAVALLKDEGTTSQQRPKFSLTPSEKRQVLDIAKRSVEAAVKRRTNYDLPADLPPSLRQDRGAFVTLKLDGELRGCIGYTIAMQPLAETVRDVAAFAALRDPRFRPVTTSELEHLSYEVSVLSPLRRVANINQINIGEHGLVIVKGERRGLLLPQVATEQQWDRNTLLDQTAMKAGLSAKAWRDKDVDLFMFTAVVFGDSEVSRHPTAEANDPFSSLHRTPAESRSDSTSR